MGNNPSVRQFKTDMTNLVNKAKYNFHQEILAMADEVIGNMQAVVRVDKGDLKNSIRKRDVSSKDGTKLSVLVIAGGRATTKRTATGQLYDHALSEEFGTRDETPSPFFYNTYRLYSRNGIPQYRETLAQTIEENNRIRANRANNYSNSSSIRSVSQGGAVVRRGKL